MNDGPAGSLSGYPPPRGRALVEPPPSVVRAAALVTWVAATGTAVVTVLLGVALLPLGATLFKAFRGGADNPVWWAVGMAALVLVLAGAADVVAVFVVRRRRWSRWVLIGLSVVAAFGGVMTAYLIVPLVVTAAAVTVVVLLFLPGARQWFRTPTVRIRF